MRPVISSEESCHREDEFEKQVLLMDGATASSKNLAYPWCKGRTEGDEEGHTVLAALGIRPIVVSRCQNGWAGRPSDSALAHRQGVGQFFELAVAPVHQEDLLFKFVLPG